MLWPKVVSSDDADWVRACTLMKVLPLDPRRQIKGKPVTGMGFVEAAEDLLTPALDRRGAPLGVFTYRLYFAVEGGVSGTIDMEDRRSQEEFVRVVSQSIQGDLTKAQRERWGLVAQWKALNAFKDPLSSKIKQKAEAVHRSSIAAYEAAFQRALEGQDLQESSSHGGRLLLHSQVMEILAAGELAEDLPRHQRNCDPDLSFSR